MNKSTYLPILSVLGGSALAVPAAAAQPAKPAGDAKRPNIIYIMSDDHAYQAIGAYGHPMSKVAPSPNIDRIAAEGIVFDRAYCGNSISGPSRATVLTGKHSHKNGFLRNDRPFDGDQQTLPKILKANGYKTAMIGKWHLHSLPQGFDYWKILVDQGHYYNPYFITEQDTTQNMGYVTDLITTQSIEWIEQQRTGDEPFFIMVHHKAPHRNWQPAPRHLTLHENTFFPYPDNFFDSYEGRVAAAEQRMSVEKDLMLGYDMKLSVKPDSDEWYQDGWRTDFAYMTPAEKEAYMASYRAANNRYHADPPTGDSLTRWKFQRYMRDYHATIASMDEGIGELLDYLEATGLKDNTIVVYASDQSFYLGEHGWYDKRFMYEESMRMPLIMRYPGEIDPGTRTGTMVQNIDFAPTFLDYCGIETPSDMQGISFREVAKGNTPDGWRESLYYRYYEYPGPHYVMPHAGVHADRYKLIYFFRNDEPTEGEYFFELYDLQTDPSEMNNLYGTAGTEELSKALIRELKRLADHYEDVLPACPELGI